MAFDDLRQTRLDVPAIVGDSIHSGQFPPNNVRRGTNAYPGKRGLRIAKNRRIHHVRLHWGRLCWDEKIQRKTGQPNV